MESFFRPLKTEREYLTHYASDQESYYIRFYNNRCRQSARSYLSPMNFEWRNATSSSSPVLSYIPCATVNANFNHSIFLEKHQPI